MDLMRSVSTIALAVGTAVAAGAYFPAQALPFSRSLTVIANFPSDDDDQTSQTLNFSKFDPALGNLTGVVFTLANESNATDAQVSGNFTNGEGGNAAATVNSTFTIRGPGPITLFSGSDVAQASCSSGFGSLGCGPTPPIGSGSPASFPPTSTVNGAGDLPNFIGFGSFFDVFVELGLSGAFDTCTRNNPSGDQSCNLIGNARWSGELTVEFLFEPNAAPVPAPATLGLLSAGLIGLGAAARRRRA